VQLPLSDAREFQIFYLVPVVAILNGTLVTVKPTTHLLAISPHRDDFFSLTETQLDACLQLKQNSYLCNTVQASYHKTTITSSCEIDIFTNETSPRCELDVLKESTIWYPLKHPNQWIYATNDTIKLNAVCDQETFQITLNSSGLIQLRPQCILKNDLITIQGHQEMHTDIHTSYIGTGMSITSLATPSPNKPKIHAYSPSIRELESIQQQLALIKESSMPSQQLTYHHHGLIIIYMSAALVIFVLVRLLWIRCHQTKRKAVDIGLQETQQETPTPLPRQVFNVTTEC